ncbi:MAG: M48 family metalloprotease [Candidatus Aminicenantes bacterium]|nr:M48 family metalloprotease [Candidatus Aminicenantes bacterium]
MTRQAKNYFIIFGVLSILFSSCSVLEQGADLLSGSDKVSSSDVDALVQTGKALRKTFSDITEEEEYYIGRSVAALILSHYPVYENKALTDYVNTVGTALSFYSERPETYGGYHFLILDTDEVNALSAPGGLIFITKGLVKRCTNEEMLASVLAHEIAHVTAKHGLRSIKNSRLIEAFGTIGEQAVQKFGSEQLQKLTTVFEGALGDVAETLIERGYDRKYEYEADIMAVHTALKTAYNPLGLKDFLETMKVDSPESADKGWFKTHPAAEDRIARVEKEIKGISDLPVVEKSRVDRFLKLIRTIN